MKKGSIILALVGLVTYGAVAQAALTVQGNGTVYDSVLYIRWDQDGNAVKTLCDAGASIWTSFAPPARSKGGSGRDLRTICVDNGRLNWFEAEAWVAHLNANQYKGVDYWLQGPVMQPDASCSSELRGGTSGYACTGFGLGHLFNAPAPAGLGNPNQLDNNCAPNCLVNTAPFSNFQSGVYWSRTEYASDRGQAWTFNSSLGRQMEAPKGIPNYVWVVNINTVNVVKTQTARTQMNDLSATLDVYRLELGRYPTTNDGLQALVENTAGATNWNGPYLKKNRVPKDPWGFEYQYRSPGEHGGFDLWSLGPDNREGGEGENKDILSRE